MAVVTPRTLSARMPRSEARVVPAETTLEAPEPIRLQVRGLRTASVARTAAVLGALVAFSAIAAGVAVWAFAGAIGVLDGLERAIASGLGMDAWSLPAGTLLLGWVAAVGITTTLAVAFVVLLTIAFNAMARAGRGVDLLTEAVPAPDAS